jgi:hypothetical protein
MCGGCDPTVSFSWLGGLLINASFMALISWGTATFWPVGLTFSALYSVILFYGAKWLKERKAPTIAVDMVLLLAVFSIGAAGLILSYNTVGCAAVRSTSPVGDDSWIFPTANASDAVVEWAAEPQHSSGSQASYAYEASSGKTFFVARASYNQGERLWRTSPSSEPEQLSNKLQNVRSLVAIKVPSSRVCFVARREREDDASADSPFGSSSDSNEAVHCYTADGSKYTTITTAEGSPAPLYPQALFVDGPDLWFKANAPFGITPDSGVVYRANGQTATLVSVPEGEYSYPSPPPPGSTDCDGLEGVRSVALAMLFLATLPVLLTAVAVWWKLHANSMAFATFCATSALVINLYVRAAPLLAQALERAAHAPHPNGLGHCSGATVQHSAHTLSLALSPSCGGRSPSIQLAPSCGI